MRKEKEQEKRESERRREGVEEGLKERGRLKPPSFHRVCVCERERKRKCVRTLIW